MVISAQSLSALGCPGVEHDHARVAAWLVEQEIFSTLTLRMAGDLSTLEGMSASACKLEVARVTINAGAENLPPGCLAFLQTTKIDEEPNVRPNSRSPRGNNKTIVRVHAGMQHVIVCSGNGPVNQQQFIEEQLASQPQPNIKGGPRHVLKELQVSVV